MDGSDSMQEKWISLIVPMYRNFPAVRETLAGGNGDEW